MVSKIFSKSCFSRDAAFCLNIEGTCVEFITLTPNNMFFLFLSLICNSVITVLLLQKHSFFLKVQVQNPFLYSTGTTTTRIHFYHNPQYWQWSHDAEDLLLDRGSNVIAICCGLFFCLRNSCRYLSSFFTGSSFSGRGVFSVIVSLTPFSGKYFSKEVGKKLNSNLPSSSYSMVDFTYSLSLQWLF